MSVWGFTVLMGLGIILLVLGGFMIFYGASSIGQLKGARKARQEYLQDKESYTFIEDDE